MRLEVYHYTIGSTIPPLHTLKRIPKGSVTRAILNMKGYGIKIKKNKSLKKLEHEASSASSVLKEGTFALNVLIKE